MAQTTNTQQARIVNTIDHGKLDVKALVLLAVLLAAGFILNSTVGKVISSATGGAGDDLAHGGVEDEASREEHGEEHERLHVELAVVDGVDDASLLGVGGLSHGNLPSPKMPVRFVLGYSIHLFWLGAVDGSFDLYRAIRAGAVSARPYKKGPRSNREPFHRIEAWRERLTIDRPLANRATTSC